MNDLDTLRSAFPEQPAPTTEVVTAARQRLTEQAGTPTRRRSNWLGTHRLGTALTAGMAAVAITVFAIPLAQRDSQEPPVDSAPPVPGSTGVRQLTANQILLAAATRQEQATGRYYRIRTIGASRMLRIGTGPSAYTLEQRWVHETWIPAKDSDPAWFGSRYLGARPATAEDKAKWERAGSPTRWRLEADTEDGYRIVTAAPDKGQLDRIDDNVAKRYELGSREGLTAAQIRKLPTDTAQLRKFLLRTNGLEGTRISDASWLFHMTSGLLLHTPAPPKVRAAAFRILAGLPDIRNEGEARDKLGRTGTALTLTQLASDGSFSVTYRLLIDSTSRMLSFATTGPKSGEQVIDAAGWTNDTPRIPPIR